MRTHRAEIEDTKRIMLSFAEAAERVSAASKRKQRIIYALGAVVAAQWVAILGLIR